MDEKNFEFLLYRSADEEVSVNALVKDETIWLSQKTMAELRYGKVKLKNMHNIIMIKYGMNVY